MPWPSVRHASSRLPLSAAALPRPPPGACAAGSGCGASGSRLSGTAPRLIGRSLIFASAFPVLSHNSSIDPKLLAGTVYANGFVMRVTRREFPVRGHVDGRDHAGRAEPGRDAGGDVDDRDLSRRVPLEQLEVVGRGHQTRECPHALLLTGERRANLGPEAAPGAAPAAAYGHRAQMSRRSVCRRSRKRNSSRRSSRATPSSPGALCWSRCR